MPNRILVVDDQEYNRELVGRILSLKGYEVLYARNAEQAITLAKSGHPEVILMDIGLPDQNGIEATGILKQSSATADIPIIAVSAHADHPDGEISERSGFFGFVSKPIDFTILLSTIKSALKSELRQTKQSG